MSQDLWNEEVYQTETTSRKERMNKGVASTRVFTILATIFFLIVLAIGIFAIYLSIGGSTTNSTQEFYNVNNAAVAASSSTIESFTEAPAAETTETTETITSESTPLVDTGDGTTLTVQAGEGLGQLAYRAGVSMSELERLNPEKMVGPNGTWWANPGDVIRIR
ncbi:TPA: LysM peptidoglycan-binding domain-containing protein [Streptococcus suis]|nr:LysM peptidoglycan-binding domain-containing protein [Streptococcus suis]